MCETTNFEITADVAYSPKPRGTDFRGASECYCQFDIRHETREPWKPANSIKEESKIGSYLASEFKSTYEQVDIHYTFVAKSDR